MASYSLSAASSCEGIGGIVFVTPAGYRSALQELEGLLDGPTERDVPIEAVVGGPTRQASVRAGLTAVPADADAVVVHDAARPFATPELFGRLIDALGAGHLLVEHVAGDGPDGVVPALPCHDTVKRVRNGLIVETVPRDELFLVQTPQAFRADALRRAHESAVERGVEGTDDAMLLEAAGYGVAVIEGEPANVKITTAEDLARAERYIASGASAGAPAIGHHA
jgi:2-C-methyl-D-erythritol 4-phosphate cytidylyltransferase/2-C-methyl-D-erythritol 2,4-cyclodiphosphate synthase